MAMTAVTTFATSTLAWTVGARRARARSEQVASVAHRQLSASRDVAERRARELNAQNAVWRSSSLAPRELPAQPVYVDRMAPIEHDALVGMLRGLTLIDDAVIADATGLARTREADRESAAIAALASHVETLRQALSRVGAGVAEVRVETFDAVHVAIRMLSGRAEGAMLVVRSTSMRVSPLALDAVAHVASGGLGELAAPPVPSIWRGGADRVRPADGGPTGFFDDLEQELVRSKLRAVVFGAHGKASFSAASDGPAESVRAAAFLALDNFQARAARLLHGAGMARVDVMLHGGSVLRWSSLAREPSWAVVLLADDGATSPALVERLSGRLRRGMGAAPATANGSVP
jgi:hypothetical protein